MCSMFRYERNSGGCSKMSDEQIEKLSEKIIDIVSEQNGIKTRIEELHKENTEIFKRLAEMEIEGKMTIKYPNEDEAYHNMEEINALSEKPKDKPTIINCPRLNKPKYPKTKGYPKSCDSFYGDEIKCLKQHTIECEGEEKPKDSEFDWAESYKNLESDCAELHRINGDLASKIKQKDKEIERLEEKLELYIDIRGSIPTSEVIGKSTMKYVESYRNECAEQRKEIARLKDELEKEDKPTNESIAYSVKYDKEGNPTYEKPKDSEFEEHKKEVLDIFHYIKENKRLIEEVERLKSELKISKDYIAGLADDLVSDANRRHKLEYIIEQALELHEKETKKAKQIGFLKDGTRWFYDLFKEFKEILEENS